MKALGTTYYNEELKKRYIREKETQIAISSNYIDSQFRKAAETEYEHDKDLSNWTLYEIVEFYKLLNLSSYESLLCINSTLSLYTQFCLENNLVKDNQNHYLECTGEVLLNCVNKAIFDKKIIDRETILRWIDELPNPKDQFILLSLFEFGKSKDFKDIIYAKPRDVNGNYLKLESRTVYISDKLKDIIDECIETEEYISISGKQSRIVPLVDYGYIVKSYPNQNISLGDHQKGRNIYVACQRMFSYLGVGQWMSPNAVSESGKLYMIKESAKNLNMTPVEYIYSKCINEVEPQFNFVMIPSTYIKKYKEYLV